MDDILKYLVDDGMIDISRVQEEMEMSKREELLKQHKYAVSQGKDGKWRTYVPDKEKGRRMIKRTTKESLEEALFTYYKIQEENPTIAEVFEEWNDRRLELKKISEATHLRNKSIFKRHYEEFGKRRIKSVEVQDIEEFLEEQIPEHDLTAKAFSNLKTVTRGLLKRAKKRKLIDFNVEEIFQELDTSESDFKKTIKEDYEEVFDESEMSVIMQYLRENLDTMNISIMLMFVTGVRIGEVATLKHQDFDGNTFKVRRTETRYRGKNGKYICEVKECPKTQAGVRTVIIPDDYSWLSRLIQRQNPFGEYIFVKDGERISTQSIRMRLKRICKKLNIYHKSPHKIRKTYGSILLDNHIDNKLIIGQMGHADIICTEKYYHRNRRDIDKKREIISSIPEFQSK